MPAATRLPAWAPRAVAGAAAAVLLCGGLLAAVTAGPAVASRAVTADAPSPQAQVSAVSLGLASVSGTRRGPSPAPSTTSAAPVGPVGTGAPRLPATVAPISLPPLPTTGPTVAPGTGAVDSDTSGSHCGYFNVSCHVTSAINGWFSGLVADALHPILTLLGRTVLATPNLPADAQIGVLWDVSAGIANAAFVLLIIVGGLLVMGYETVQTRYSVKDIAPRLVLGLIAVNASLAVAGLLIGIANTLSAALLGPGSPGQGAAGQISALVLAQLGSGIFLTLIAGVVAVLGLMLLAGYVFRVAVLAVLIAGAPLLLAGHALPQTDGLARLWWRAVGACLAVQVGQALTLTCGVEVFLHSGGTGVFGLGSGGGLVDLLVVGVLLGLLVAIPMWASKAVFGRTASTAGRLVRDVLVYRVIRTSRPGGAGGSGGAGGRHAAGRGGDRR